MTPEGTLLDLSIIDRLPVLRCNTRTLHVFRHGPEAARVIREALSKALVPYYPLAGKLKESSQGQLQIECSGEGVWFVEASADCTLYGVNYLDDDIVSIPYDELLPDHIPENEGIDPLVQFQVNIPISYNQFILFELSSKLSSKETLVLVFAKLNVD